MRFRLMSQRGVRRVSQSVVRVTALLCLLLWTAPSSADVWVASDTGISKVDGNGQTLLSISSVFGTDFGYQIGFRDVLEVNPRNGDVWVSDVNRNRIFQLDANGTPLREVPLFAPIAIGINPNTETVWTSILLNAVTFPRAVIEIDADTGEELARVTGFSRSVSAIAIGPSGEVWVADRFNNEVVLLFGTREELNGYDATGPSGPHHQRLPGFVEPMDLVVDMGESSGRAPSIWAADRENHQAVKFAADGTELLRVSPSGFSEVRWLSVDPRDGSVWVAGTEQVAKLSTAGEELVTNLSYRPTSLAFSLEDDSVWVASGVESAATLFRLDSNGSELLSVGGFGTITSVSPTSGAFPLALDVKPDSASNSINPRSAGVIPVAILATDNTDIAAIDTATVRFGRNGSEAAPLRFTLEDADNDADLDLVLFFRASETGILCGDTFVSLTAATFDGIPLQGWDSIRTVGCKADR